MTPHSRFLADDHVTEITPREFELLVKDLLTKEGKRENLPLLDIRHDNKEHGRGGTYQIDIKATFEVFGGSQITVLVECKHYKQPIKREKVELLYGRLQSLGAQKGILFSTSPFQQGAIDFAKSHGIALVFVMEGKFTYETRSLDQQRFDPQPWANIPKYVGVYAHNYRENRFNVSDLAAGHNEALINFVFGIGDQD
jgi:restriction system protein